MPEVIYLPLTPEELQALNDWHTEGGVVGEAAELDLERAKDIIRRRVAEEVVPEQDPTFGLDYWKITAAVNRALHDLEQEEGDPPLTHGQVFWRVCSELTDAYPQFDWKNTLTDSWPRSDY